jgi:hypothetical protein
MSENGASSNFICSYPLPLASTTAPFLAFLLAHKHRLLLFLNHPLSTFIAFLRLWSLVHLGAILPIHCPQLFLPQGLVFQLMTSSFFSLRSLGLSYIYIRPPRA